MTGGMRPELGLKEQGGPEKGEGCEVQAPPRSGPEIGMRMHVCQATRRLANGGADLLCRAQCRPTDDGFPRACPTIFYTLSKTEPEEEGKLSWESAWEARAGQRAKVR